jgi:N-acyl-D-amino-acid deacylase
MVLYHFFRKYYRTILLGFAALVLMNEASIANDQPALLNTADASYNFVSLDQTIKQYMHRYQIPGAAVAVIYKGKLIYSRGYGWADKDNQQPVAANSLFRIASVSKIITATAILQLIQQGKLHYQDKLLDVLSDLTPLPGMKLNPLLHRVTIQDLLLMLSGWGNSHIIGYDANFGPLPSFFEYKYHVSAPLPCYEAARFMMGMPMQHIPGTHFDYANISYCYLGLVVAKVNQLPYTPVAYEAYIKQHLLQPIGISDMRLGSTDTTLPGEVHYYADEPNYGLPYGATQVLQKAYPAGGWLASAIDLAKFSAGLKKILAPAQISFISTVPKGVKYPIAKHHNSYFYSSGWWLYGSHTGLLWIAHGSFSGTRAIILHRPDDTVIAVIFNKLPKPTTSALARLHVLLEHLQY